MRFMIFSLERCVPLCGVGAYYLFIFSTYFWTFSEIACAFIKKIIGVVSRPFRLIWDSGTERLKIHAPIRRKGAIDRFADRHPICGSAASIRFFIFSVVFLCVAIIISAFNGGIGKFIMDTLSMFPFFFVIEVINKNVEFSFAGLISTGFLAMLIGAFFNLCMGEYSRKGSFSRWLVSIGYYLVTTTVACYVGFVLSNVWEWVGAMGVSLFNALKNILLASSWSFIGVLRTGGCVIALFLILRVNKGELLGIGDQA